jgi:hypothetical protein
LYHNHPTAQNWHYYQTTEEEVNEALQFKDTNTKANITKAGKAV